MADAYTQLSSLRTMLAQRQLEHMGAMAKGVEVDRYRELVGRAKEAQWLAEKVTEQIKSMNAGDDDGADDSLNKT